MLSQKLRLHVRNYAVPKFCFNSIYYVVARVFNPHLRARKNYHNPYLVLFRKKLLNSLDPCVKIVLGYKGRKPDFFDFPALNFLILLSCLFLLGMRNFPKSTILPTGGVALGAISTSVRPSFLALAIASSLRSTPIVFHLPRSREAWEP